MQQLTTNREILETYQELMHLEGLRSKTIRTYKQLIKDFFIFCPDLTDETISRYMIQKKNLVDKGQISNSHYNQIYFALQKYYRNFYERELPYKIKPLKVPFKEPPRVNPESIIQARQRLENGFERCVFDLAVGSLMRRAEIQQLRWDKIDCKNKIIEIHNGKGGKPRKTIISQLTLIELDNFLESKLPNEKLNPYVFSAYNSKTRYISESTVYKVLVKAGQLVGEKWWTHLMRHAGTAILGEADVNAKKIQDLLGHSRLETTQRYLNLLERKTLQVVTPLDRLLLHKDSSTDVKK